jgi:putative RecB family exonuclease
MGAPKGTMPSDADIDHYFGEVENALRSHGVRPASPAVAEKAKRILKLFNRIEGPALYPRVFDTEYRLESDRGEYVLRGVVDVLATGRGAGADPSKMEIWDYKGTKLPDLSSTTLRDYVWQMCVYAELYRVRSGAYPAKAVLYFLNELEQEPEPSARPLRAVYEVQFSPKLIEDALGEFNVTALDIIACQASLTWPNPIADPGKETCDICDIRWNCPVKKGVYLRRLPI